MRLHFKYGVVFEQDKTFELVKAFLDKFSNYKLLTEDPPSRKLAIPIYAVVPSALRANVEDLTRKSINYELETS